MTATRFDVIVLGLGGMGSAAAYELARRGRRVLGLDRFDFAHARGSAHGGTRIIRTLYYEHPDYVPLVTAAFARWHDLEQATGRHLLTPCECVTVGPADGEQIVGVRTAAARLGLKSLAEFDRAELRTRYGLHAPAGFVGVPDSRAGFLYVEAAVQAHIDAAIACGAKLRPNEPALEWHADAGGVEVRTARGTYSAAKLVVTAGAWATDLLKDIGVPLAVMRQVMHWFPPKTPAAFRRDRFPIFMIDAPDGAFYGLPMIDARGVKVAQHYAAPELADPADVNWQTTPADAAPVQDFLAEYFPGEFGPPAHSQACMYTLTPDRHFVIDTHPGFANVSVAAGFSGHGFKFASVVGDILADLAETGSTTHPIGLFGAGRLARLGE